MPTVLCQGLRVSTAVRLIGLEPTRLAAPDPKSGVSTNSTTSALERLRDSTNQPFDGAKVRILVELANIFGQKMQASLLFSVFAGQSLLFLCGARWEMQAGKPPAAPRGAGH